MEGQIALSAYDERREQCERILDLLQRHEFVPTSVMRMVAFQYNARIYELRRERGYKIVKARKDRKCGFRLERTTWQT